MTVVSDVEVRNVTVWTGLSFDAMDAACREQAQEGFALVRIVPYTASQAVAVFERRPAVNTEHGSDPS